MWKLFAALHEIEPCRQRGSRRAAERTKHADLAEQTRPEVKHPAAFMRIPNAGTRDQADPESLANHRSNCGNLLYGELFLNFYTGGGKNSLDMNRFDACQVSHHSSCMRRIQIGIIGDFNAGMATHIYTNDGIRHAAAALGASIDPVWLPTDQPAKYARFQGLFGSPGSPYRSFAGALTGIRYAREHGIPFLGTRGGLQHLMIEYARNVMGLMDAAHAETEPHASCLFITPLSCSLVGETMVVTIKPGSNAAAAYQAESSRESYYCNFGLNPEYRDQMEKAGLAVTGTDENGEVRVVEVASHPFFIGTLYVPQARSKPGIPHPLVLAFCRAAISQAK